MNNIKVINSNDQFHLNDSNRKEKRPDHQKAVYLIKAYLDILIERMNYFYLNIPPVSNQNLNCDLFHYHTLYYNLLMFSTYSTKFEQFHHFYHDCMLYNSCVFLKSKDNFYLYYLLDLYHQVLSYPQYKELFLYRNFHNYNIYLFLIYLDKYYQYLNAVS